MIGRRNGVRNSAADQYDVVLFGPIRRVYARFKGAVEISN